MTRTYKEARTTTVKLTTEELRNLLSLPPFGDIKIGVSFITEEPILTITCIEEVTNA